MSIRYDQSFCQIFVEMILSEYCFGPVYQKKLWGIYDWSNPLDLSVNVFNALLEQIAILSSFF